MILFAVILIIFFLSLRGGISLASIISCIYIISLIGMFLLSPSIFFDINFDISDTLYLIIFYTFLILPWSQYKVKRPTELKLTAFDLKVYKFYKYIGVVCFVTNLATFHILQGVVTDYSAFKNGGDNVGYLQYLPVPHMISLFISWFSRTYLFMLPYHFYYLKKGNIKESFVAFLLAGNYILVGMAGFSRSSTVSFILIYGVLFIYFSQMIDKKILRKVSKYLLICVISVGTVFYVITLNRFSGENEFVADAFVHSDGLIKDPVLNSQVSYLSQWYEKTSYWLPKYPETELTYGVRSGSLLYFTLLKLGINDAHDRLPNELYKQFGGRDMGAFMGICTNLTFDIGIFCTLLIVLIYAIIIRKNKYKYQACSIIDFFLIVLLIDLPITGIFNSCMNGMGWHVALMFFLTLKLIQPKMNPNLY